MTCTLTTPKQCATESIKTAQEQTFPEQTVLVGNIDQIDLLMDGPNEAIRRSVRSVFDAVRAAGRAGSR